MATLQRVLEILSSQAAPISQQAMEDLLGEKQSAFKTQLDRLKKREQADQNENKEWYITDGGRTELKRMAEESATPVGSSLELTQEEAGVTPYAQFVDIGKAIGVSANDALMRVIADYVWNGGDYRDPVWVASALKGMSIRPDLVERWVNAWSTKPFVNKENVERISRQLQIEKLPAEEKKRAKEDEIRDYIVDENGDPVKVGEGAGTMTYKDAVELGKVRALGIKRGNGGSVASGKSVAEQIQEMVNAVDMLRGNQTPQPNYMVKPDGNGGWSVETVEQGKPVVIPAPVSATPKKEIWVFKDGVLKKLEDGEPIVVSPPPLQNTQPKYIMIDKDGKQQEVAPGQPIIIYKEAPTTAPPVSGVPITLKDEKGNPITVDYGQLETFFRIEEWKDRRRREEDKHTGQMELISTLKDLAKKGAAALEDMTASKEGSK